MRLIDAEFLKAQIQGMYMPEYVREGLNTVIDNTPTIEPPEIQAIMKDYLVYQKDLWIPIEYRPMSEFEYNEFLAAYGYLEPEERKMFCCQMPEDQQEILISTKWGICLDKCEIDLDDNDNPVYGLEERGDWDDVMAWMPLPEQYKGGEKK